MIYGDFYILLLLKSPLVTTAEKNQYLRFIKLRKYWFFRRGAFMKMFIFYYKDDMQLNDLRQPL